MARLAGAVVHSLVMARLAGAVLHSLVMARLARAIQGGTRECLPGPSDALVFAGL